MMYEELVKRLRTATALPVMNSLCQEAADAIEELSQKTRLLEYDFQSADAAYHSWFDAYQKDVPKWISVEERLPKRDGDYLVWFCDAKCWKVAEFNKHTLKERPVWWFAGIDRTKFVTHWMPLPEPPDHM